MNDCDHPSIALKRRFGSAHTRSTRVLTELCTTTKNSLGRLAESTAIGSGALLDCVLLARAGRDDDLKHESESEDDGCREHQVRQPISRVRSHRCDHRHDNRKADQETGDETAGVRESQQRVFHDVLQFRR